MDLEPGYRELAAPAALRDVVACVWVRVAGGAGEVRVTPDACVDVVWRRGHGATIAGPDTSAKLVATDPGDVIVGLRFAPGAGGAALGVPLDELCDLRPDAADVAPSFALDPDAAPADVIGGLVAAAAAREPVPDPLVAEAVVRLGAGSAGRDIARDLGAHGGACDLGVRGLARDLCVSERQLRRRFHAAVGYGPKTLARILRFRRFLGALDDGATDLAALALGAGYADQAHLTRECTRLAGLPPARLMRARAAAPPAAGTAARPPR